MSPPSICAKAKAFWLYPVIRFAILATVPLRAVFPSNYDSLWFNLYCSKRHVYNKLREIAPGTLQSIETSTNNPCWKVFLQTETHTASSTGEAAKPLSSTPNTLSEWLHRSRRPLLPQPATNVLAAVNKATSRQDEELSEVNDLRHRQSSGASVCFVLFLSGSESEAIDRTLQSVFRQTDPSWELLLCAQEDPNPFIDQWLDRDWRIRRLAPQNHEVTALVQAAQVATASFVGLITPGDLVDDELAAKIIQLADGLKDLTAVYTNEARLDFQGNAVNHFYKPGWSPDHQMAANFVGRFFAIKKGFLLNLLVEGWQTSPMAEYLLSLRLIAKGVKVAHIDETLYLRAASSSSYHHQIGGQFSASELNSLIPEMQRFVQLAMDPAATVEGDQDSGSLRVRWSIPKATAVTLLILTNMRQRDVENRGNILMVLNFVKSIIQKSTYSNYKIIVVDDGFVPDELSELLKNHGHTSQTYAAQGDFSFAAKSNFATSLAAPGVVILLNDDLEVISEDWIEALVEQACRPDVGVVGGKLLFPNGTIQHAGISIGLNGSAGHVFMGHESDALEYGGYASVIRNQAAVTGALMAYRKDFFETMGGFDEFFRVDYNDIDFCLRCISKGFRVVYTPYAKLYHFHNSTFNRQHDMGHERSEFLKRWKKWADLDPYCGLLLAPICQERTRITAPSNADQM
jgi:O-antigen biosynthesis protein